MSVQTLRTANQTDHPVSTGAAAARVRAAPKVIRRILDAAGVELNGPRLWDVQLHDERALNRMVAYGSLGMGESYVDGQWDCAALDELAYRVLRSEAVAQVIGPDALFASLKARLINLQSRRRAFKIAEAHYDLGNDLFEAMLDRRLVYTCGYWARATALDAAQEDKLDLVCRKLGLVRGMRVLDIGCGWGSFAKFAAERYNVEVVGITVSREQIELGAQLCGGLPIELRLEDYRDTRGAFDRVVSLGMFEHVGARNYRTYFECVRRLLKPDGLFLLHTIGHDTTWRTTDPWIGKYIFPNSLIPSVAQVTAAFEGQFVMEDWHTFGEDYDKTLMAWWRNFEAAWPMLRERYGDRFYRLWRYYLLTCAGTFRARLNNLWQIVLSPQGVPGGYTSIR
jgi:cyclopropane-fatty-acyl-phospholipid synthase